MKLYTEEQVREILKSTHIHTDNDVDMILPQFTPIELPSDEEIKEAAPYVPKDAHDYYIVFRGGFLEGAKWMKDKILNK